jgi:hypothetical protein
MLNAQIGRRPGTLSLDVNSISKSRGGSVGPATSTILRNMLISGGAGEIHSIDVSPIPGFGNILRSQVSVGKGLRNTLSSGGLAKLIISFYAVALLGENLRAVVLDREHKLCCYKEKEHDCQVFVHLI